MGAWPSKDEGGGNEQSQTHEVHIMYLGTEASKVSSILQNGIKVEPKGLLGPGIYVSRDASRTHANGIVTLKLLVARGRSKRIDSPGDPEASNWQSQGYDSAYIPRSNYEAIICVKRPQQVVVLGVCRGHSYLPPHVINEARDDWEWQKAREFRDPTIAGSTSGTAVTATESAAVAAATATIGPALRVVQWDRGGNPTMLVRSNSDVGSADSRSDKVAHLSRQNERMRDRLRDTEKKMDLVLKMYEELCRKDDADDEEVGEKQKLQENVDSLTKEVEKLEAEKRRLENEVREKRKEEDRRMSIADHLQDVMREINDLKAKQQLSTKASSQKSEREWWDRDQLDEVLEEEEEDSTADKNDEYNDSKSEKELHKLKKTSKKRGDEIKVLRKDLSDLYREMDSLSKQKKEMAEKLETLMASMERNASDYEDSGDEEVEVAPRKRKTKCKQLSKKTGGKSSHKAKSEEKVLKSQPSNAELVRQIEELKHIVDHYNRLDARVREETPRWRRQRRSTDGRQQRDAHAVKRASKKKE